MDLKHMRNLQCKAVTFACHSHFYANLHASVTLLFYSDFHKFSPKCITKKLWMMYTILWSFCSFLNWWGTNIQPKIRLRKTPALNITCTILSLSWYLGEIRLDISCELSAANIKPKGNNKYVLVSTLPASDNCRLLITLTLCPLEKVVYMLFCSVLIFSKSNFFKNFFQEYHQSVKQFGFRSGPTFCRAWSGSKLFAKVISRWH